MNTSDNLSTPHWQASMAPFLPHRRSWHTGFTLIEITIVLLIISLLAGGILAGRELINSARVRNLEITLNNIEAAYYAFIERYRQIPGDMTKTDAQTLIGDGSIDAGGNSNGKLDSGDYKEAAAAWVHLSSAGFLKGRYEGNDTTLSADDYQSPSVAPTNPFSGYLLLGRSHDYSTTAGAPASSNAVRLGLILGANLPVRIALELDAKIDDGKPLTGKLRFTGTTTIDYGSVSAADVLCMTSATSNAYDTLGNYQDCNLIYLF